MEDSTFSIALPANPLSCAVFSSPHSGSDYPEPFLSASRLDAFEIRSSEDAYVDELFMSAPSQGAPLIAARVPRAVVDLNRAPEDLDPALISGASRRGVNPRIAAGLGVIPRVVGEGRTIIEGKLPLAEAEARIARYWQPYHRELQALVAAQLDRFGAAILFDCHSMPRDALQAVPIVWGRRPDVVLGDRFGVSCARWVIEEAARIFADEGFIVARNSPFAGGYITQAYGRPAAGQHALQIEIDRSLYMDEARIEKRQDFDVVRDRIAAAVACLAGLGGAAMPIAAE